MKRIIAIILIAISIFTIGFFSCRHYTIIGAKLNSINTDEDTYTIEFNGSIHYYTGGIIYEH